MSEFSDSRAVEASASGGVHSRIPAECFATETYDCAADPTHMCCAYM